MRRLALAVLLAACGSGPPAEPSACDGAVVPDKGELVGTVRVDGDDFRVQLAELPPFCMGITSSSRHLITMARGLGDYLPTAMHELGHGLRLARKDWFGQDGHLDDPNAVMHRYVGAVDFSPADLQECRDEGVCPRATDLDVQPDPADAMAEAALRWSAVVKPEFRPTFTAYQKDQ